MENKESNKRYVFLNKDHLLKLNTNTLIIGDENSGKKNTEMLFILEALQSGQKVIVLDTESPDKLYQELKSVTKKIHYLAINERTIRRFHLSSVNPDTEILFCNVNFKEERPSVLKGLIDELSEFLSHRKSEEEPIMLVFSKFCDYANRHFLKLFQDENQRKLSIVFNICSIEELKANYGERLEGVILDNIETVICHKYTQKEGLEIVADLTKHTAKPADNNLTSDESNSTHFRGESKTINSGVRNRTKWQVSMDDIKNLKTDHVFYWTLHKKIEDEYFVPVQVVPYKKIKGNNVY